MKHHSKSLDRREISRNFIQWKKSMQKGRLERKTHRRVLRQGEHTKVEELEIDSLKPSVPVYPWGNLKPPGVGKLQVEDCLSRQIYLIFIK